MPCGFHAMTAHVPHQRSSQEARWRRQKSLCPSLPQSIFLLLVPPRPLCRWELRCPFCQPLTSCSRRLPVLARDRQRGSHNLTLGKTDKKSLVSTSCLATFSPSSWQRVAMFPTSVQQPGEQLFSGLGEMINYPRRRCPIKHLHISLTAKGPHSLPGGDTESRYRVIRFIKRIHSAFRHLSIVTGV